jgi:diguanylate cyclase (GGDEF)-like protein/PAS domain S-box-containing protein
MFRLNWPLRPDHLLQRRLAYLVLLAACALVGADAVSLWSARHEAVTGSWAESANLARSLADQAHGVFQLTDSVLEGMREQVESDGTMPAALQRLSKMVATAQQALPMLYRLMVLDAQGRVLAFAGPGLAPSIINPEAAFFAYHRASANRASYVGWPIRDPVDGTWQLSVSIRIDAPPHVFGGVVVGFLPIEFFRNMIGNYDVGPHGLISMMREDGVVIARQPFNPGDIGRNLGKLSRPLQRDNLETTSPIDGRVRLNSYVWLQDEPVMAMVGRSKQEVLAGWRLLALCHAIGLVVVLGVLWVLTLRLSRSIGEAERSHALLRQSNAQLAQSEARTAQANQRLELAEQLAQVGHWHLNLADGYDLSWSDEVYRLHGLAKADFSPSPKHVIDAYHPDDRRRVRQAILEAISTGMPFELLARIVWSDGTLRHVLTRGFYQSALPGGSPSIFGVIMDVTEQKHSEAELVAARAKAEAANAALEAANEALQAMALQDSLTGLSNRRHFDRALDQEFRRSVRAGVALGMILFDVDKFKEYNDLYGHQAGDACLRAIASTIPALLNRPGDIAARYGGEEIALLLPGTTEAGAKALAERVAQAVRDLAIAHAGSPHGVVTISAGVEAFVPVRDVDTAALLVEHADLALYAAKRAGRNAVLAFHEIVDASGESKLRVFHA